MNFWVVFLYALIASGPAVLSLVCCVCEINTKVANAS